MVEEMAGAENKVEEEAAIVNYGRGGRVWL